MVASVDVPSTIDSCEPLETGGEARKRRRVRQEWRTFNPVMQKPDPAGSYCEAARRNSVNTSVHRVTLRSHLPTYTVDQPPREDKGNARMSINLCDGLMCHHVHVTCVLYFTVFIVTVSQRAGSCITHNHS